MITVMKTDLTRCLAGTFIIGIILIGVLCSIFLVDRTIQIEIGELKQVHVIFSHGERTPTFEEMQSFPLSVNHNQTYFPYGYGALTNEGKMRMYKLGIRLKTHYEEFLGKNYDVSKFTMQTINTDVSKMSALLLMAGLWPIETNTTWNIHTWQPIPYNTMRDQNDYFQYEYNCPRFKTEKEKAFEEYMPRNDLPYAQLFELINLYTGSNITQISQVVQLAEFMDAQSFFTNTTPRWYQNLERIIRSVIKTESKVKYQKNIMKEISSGYFFKKIYLDWKEQKTENGSNKMFCYSVSVNNIQALLSDTKLKQVIPKLGSAFIVELYSTVSHYSEYIYKFMYYDGKSPIPTMLDLHRCEYPCFLHNFKTVIAKTLHKDYETECSS